MSTLDHAKLDEYRQHMRKEWTVGETAAAWRKWFPQMSEWSRPLDGVILEAASVAPGHHVLDVASGSGNPALALARAVGPAGLVTASDLGAEMLSVAEENARAAGLTNIRFRQADAEQLPFPDQSFDRLTCRCGVMFFPDHDRALRECRRVLKDGGRAVFVAWGPREQPFFSTTVGVLRRYVEIPAPEPGSPNAFKFAEPGSLRGALEQAGFRPAHEESREIPTAWPGPPREFWESFQEIAAPFRPYIQGLSPEVYQQVTRDVYAALEALYDGRAIRFPARMVLAAGVRS